MSFTFDGDPHTLRLTVGTFDDPIALAPREEWSVDAKVSGLPLPHGIAHWPTIPV